MGWYELNLAKNDTVLMENLNIYVNVCEPSNLEQRHKSDTSIK